jgi:hypothetical protein
MNTHYKLKYDNFIAKIQKRGVTNETYKEVHHIIPKCLGGGNQKENLITLSLREHYLAHLLLAKAYETRNLVSAFVQMDNKNKKHYLKKKFIPKSKLYEKEKIKFYKILGGYHKNKVRVKTEMGETLTLSSEEYKKSNYKFHTTGMVSVFNNETKEQDYITTEDYHKNKDRYLSFGIREYSIVKVLDKQTNIVFTITLKEYREKYKSIKFLPQNKLKEKQRYTLYKEKVDFDVKHINVIDKKTKTNKTLSLDEFKNSRNEYLTIGEEKVKAFDTHEKKYVTVDKKDFDGKRFVGQTKGLTTVYSKKDNKYVTMTVEEFSKNKEQYAGPCFGKVNVVDLRTGERKQIEKMLFDKKMYCSLGVKTLLFKCKHKKTNKEKNINIYEWKFIKQDYEVIDEEKFKKLLHLIKEN